MTGRLLLVIPSVLSCVDGAIALDRHFANNLEAYLDAFDHVTVACPLGPGGQINLVSLNSLPGRERTSVVVVPEP